MWDLRPNFTWNRYDEQRLTKLLQFQKICEILIAFYWKLWNTTEAICKF